MNKREIKQNLIKEDYLLTSNLKDKVLTKVGLNKEHTINKQRRFNFKWAYSSLVLAFGLVLVFSLFIFKRPESYSTIFVDINPSLSLKVNTKEIVKEVTPLNEDGIIFILDMELVDLNLDDVIDIIVDEAINNGYFTEDFANVSISTLNKNQKQADKINNQVNNRLKDKVFNINIQNDSEEAKELGISTGKLNAIKKALEADESLTIDEALKMNEDKLLEKINNQAKNNKDKFEENFKEHNNDERKIIQLVNQMTSIINNINNRPGRQHEAYYNFKRLYDEYLVLIDIVDNDFLENDIINNFNNLLNDQEDLLDIINNLEDIDSNKPDKDPNRPGGPNKGEDKDPNEPGSPNKDPDRPGRPNDNDDEKPGGNGKEQKEDNPPSKGNSKGEEDKEKNQKGKK